MQLSSRTCAPRAQRRPTQSRRCVVVRAAIDVEQLKGAKEELMSYITSKNCNPIVIRLAWHDSGTYDKNIQEWPARGGANASIRFKPEIEHGANAGLALALTLLKPIQKKFPNVSYADLFQLASVCAVEAAGGPKVPMRYGRKDVESAEQCAKDGNLPGAAHPFADGSASPGEHLRRVFYRMGLNDQEIVALSGAHTLGRAYPNRSGHGVDATSHTKAGVPQGKAGPGTKGGQSWTADWLTFNNSYFTELKAKRDAELLVLPTDACLFEDEQFRPYAEKYAASQDAFFADYALAHQKLSELGVQWQEGGPVTI